MKFTINSALLQKELSIMQGTIEKKNTIPALSNILIESAGKSKVVLTGTDLDQTLRIEVEAEVAVEGAAGVPARKLFDIARLLPEGTVTFEVEKDTKWVRFASGRYNGRLPGIEKGSFPEVPEQKTPTIKLPAVTLHSYINMTIHAITLEESRYTLSGAKFEINGALRFVSTDGHRLAFVEDKALGKKKVGGEIDTLIPRKALAELLKLTAGVEGEIGIGTDENHLHFEIGHRRLVTRTLTGQFPNYEMVLPKGNDNRAVFETAALTQALRRVATMADDRSKSVRLHLVPGELRISAQTAEEGEAADVLHTDYKGDELEIGFNAGYLLDTLAVVGAEKVVFAFKDGNSQALFQPEGGETDFRAVIMPMRL